MSPPLTPNQRVALKALAQLTRVYPSVGANSWRAKARALAGRLVSFQPEALVRRGLVVRFAGGGYAASEAGKREARS